MSAGLHRRPAISINVGHIPNCSESSIDAVRPDCRFAPAQGTARLRVVLSQVPSLDRLPPTTCSPKWTSAKSMFGESAIGSFAKVSLLREVQTAICPTSRPDRSSGSSSRKGSSLRVRSVNTDALGLICAEPLPFQCGAYMGVPSQSWDGQTWHSPLRRV